MKGTFEIPIKQATRSCMVDGRPGVFHLWEQFSTVVPPSPMVGLCLAYMESLNSPTVSSE